MMNLKTLFWRHAELNGFAPPRLPSAHEALDLVEEFTAFAADGEIAGINPERDFPNEDLVAFEERVYSAIGLQVTCVPAEDSGLQRTAVWA